MCVCVCVCIRVYLSVKCMQMSLYLQYTFEILQVHQYKENIKPANNIHRNP